MQITKRAVNPHTMMRRLIPFRNARAAFQSFMMEQNFTSADCVLLPAYIGWSPREGSGVFDPVQHVGTRFDFYKLTRNLEIDLADLEKKLERNHPRLVILIHYFGFPDPHWIDAVSLARAFGAQVLEDEAHALYSDWVSGICGRLGDGTLLSLHKMLPVDTGGALQLNPSLDSHIQRTLTESHLQERQNRDLLGYDFWGIASARRENAQRLLDLIQHLSDKLRPLYATLPEGVIPQTLPVLVLQGVRDELYFKLNERGFGVVSLYHTLIQAIDMEVYPDSYWLSKRILNLPVHQDIQPDALKDMVNALEQLV